MANYVEFENIEVEEKPTFGDRVMDFMSDHPVVAWGLYGLVCVAVAIPCLAGCGYFVGRQAGKSAAKLLLEAGVKLT